MPHALKKRRGFSLVELLVVVAIIGVLIVLLLPSIQSVMALSRRARCATNLHQIATAMVSYTSDNGGRFPYTIHGGLAQSWVYTLMLHSNGVRICPDDPSGPDRLKTTNPGTSYLLNEYVSMETLAGAQIFITRLKSPATTIAYFEGTETRALGPASDHANPSSWYLPTNISGNKVWDTALKEIKPDRHTDSANYVYADGHVAAVSRDTVYGWVQSDIANNTCFAKPDYKPR